MGERHYRQQRHGKEITNMITTTHSNSLRFILAILAVGALLLPVSALGFFSSTQTSPQQNFSAGTLSFETIAPLPASGTVTPDTIATSSVTIETTVESIPAIYTLAVTETDGSASWCSELNITATSPNGTAASDTVGNFVSGEQTEFGEWELSFSTESASVAQAGTDCDVTFTADTWHEPMSQGVGFIDEASFTISLTFLSESENEGTGDSNEQGSSSGDDTGSSAISLNEIYANPDSASSSPLDREWVELYNSSGQAIDVAGWVITEEVASGDDAGDERPHQIIVEECESGSLSTTMVPANGSDTEIAANGFMRLEYCGSASYMSVDGDTIRLYAADGYDMDNATSTDNPVDSVTYQETSDGEAYARVPDGDGDWEVQTPTPGATNVLMGGMIFGAQTGDTDQKSKEDESKDEPKNRDENDSTGDDTTADTSKESQDKDTEEDSKNDGPDTSDSAEQDQEKRKGEDSDRDGDDGDATGSDEKMREEDVVRENEPVEDGADDAEAADGGGDDADDENEDANNDDGDDDAGTDTDENEAEDGSSDDDLNVDDAGTGTDDITLDESDSNN